MSKTLEILNVVWIQNSLFCRFLWPETNGRKKDAIGTLWKIPPSSSAPFESVVVYLGPGFFTALCDRCTDNHLGFDAQIAKPTDKKWKKKEI